MTILSDVKKTLGVQDDSFDSELLTHINGAVATLVQLGVESLSAIGTINEETEWPKTAPGIETLPPFVVSIYKSLLPLRVQTVFDPPANSTVSSSLNAIITEFEARLALYLSTIEQGLPLQVLQEDLDLLYQPVRHLAEDGQVAVFENGRVIEGGNLGHVPYVSDDEAGAPSLFYSVEEDRLSFKTKEGEVKRLVFEGD